MDRVDAEVREQGWSLLRQWAPGEVCATLAAAMDAFAEQHYGAQALQHHSAYPSDVSDCRLSFAFAVSTEPACEWPDPRLPHVALGRDNCDPALMRWVLAMHRFLGCPRGRLLMNEQLYWSGSRAIVPHHDGEVFRNSVGRGPLRALYPKRVVLMTLLNETKGGGTRLHLDGEGETCVVEAQAGDVLVFDNVRLRHSVDQLWATQEQDVRVQGQGATDGLSLWKSRVRECRRLVGLRALEDACCLWNVGNLAQPLKPVSWARAVVEHRRHLDRDWGSRCEELAMLLPHVWTSFRRHGKETDGDMNIGGGSGSGNTVPIRSRVSDD